MKFIVSSILLLLALPMASSECDFTVMTRNLYYGAQLEGLLDAESLGQFLCGLYYHINQQAAGSNFELRMEAVAKEIAENKPVIVGLQEASTYTNLLTGDQVDFVELILHELETLGHPYVVVKAADPKAFDFAFEPPALALIDPWIFPEPDGCPFATFDDNLAYHSLSSGDVLLVREDMKKKVKKEQTNAYQKFVIDDLNLGIPGIEDEIEQPRSWVSVDATLCGQTVRVVSTHLESADQKIRKSQAKELVKCPDSPLNTELPVILMGDLNSEVGTGDAVDRLLNGGKNLDGLNDAWEDAGVGGGEGITALNDPDLTGSSSGGLKRIDYILSSDELEATECRVIETVIDPFPELRPIYPSDHNGVVATFVFDDDQSDDSDDQGDQGDDQGDDGDDQADEGNDQGDDGDKKAMHFHSS